MSGAIRGLGTTLVDIWRGLCLTSCALMDFGADLVKGRLW